MSFDHQGGGIGRPSSDSPTFQTPGTYQPQPAPPQWPPMPPYYVRPTPPPKSNSAPLVIAIVAICIFLVAGISIIGVRLSTTQHSQTSTTTVPVLPPPTLYTQPTQQSTVPDTSGWQPTPPAETPYWREREKLTDKESVYYGHLKQGDCLVTSPDDYSGKVPTIDCDVPHTYQVAGFVDLSEGMPDRSDGIDFEISLSKRCNSLKAALGVPSALRNIIAIRYPSTTAWDDGVRAALCWVASYDPWVGSVVDGTAEPA